MSARAKLAVVLIALGGLCVTLGAPAVASSAPPARAMAPAVSLRIVYPDPTFRIEGQHTRLRLLRGQVVVLSFLDDGCSACKRTADDLEHLSGSMGFANLAVGVGLDRVRALTFASEREQFGQRGIAMAIDPGGAVARTFSVSRLPTIIVIDRRGRIAKRLDAPLARGAMARLLRPLLAEPIPTGLPPVRTRPHLSVFDQPAGDVGALPRPLRPETAPCPFVAGSVRLAARSPGGTRLLIARALGGGIVTVSVGPGEETFGCDPTRFAQDRRRLLASIRARGIVSAFGSTSDGKSSYALVVLDGYTEVRLGGVSYPVSNNGVIIEGVPRQTYVTLSGPAGTHRARLFE